MSEVLDPDVAQVVLADVLAGIRPVDEQARADAHEHQARLAKPAGSLGVLEDLGARLAAVAGTCPPPVPVRAAVAVFAGDHGVLAQGVSPWPQEVTGQMVAAFAAGGAAVCVLARGVGATVRVVDVGVAHPVVGEGEGVRIRRVAPGTADLTVAPAMTDAQVLQAVAVGVETARVLIAEGNQILLTGDMGIGNTTPSAALVAAVLGVDPGEVTGRGTGIDDDTLVRKVEVVRQALALHADRLDTPLGVLGAVGGLEHAAIVGLLLAAAAERVPVVLDGVIAGSAALVAHAMAPDARDHWIAGHRSVEPAHARALRALDLRPVVDLDLRLGEGTGAVLALPVVQAAARVLGEMATFDGAGVVAKETASAVPADAAAAVPPGTPGGVR